MINDDINQTPFAAADFDNDWAKEARFIEIRTEEMLGSMTTRRGYNRENYPGEELSEVERSNALAVEVERHRYEEQNK